MAKRKKRRQNSLLPMLAIGVGIYLLTRPTKAVIPVIPEVKPLPTGGGPLIQRFMPRMIPYSI